MTLKAVPAAIAERIWSASAYQSAPRAFANRSACNWLTWATTSTSYVARGTPRTDDAIEPPIKYGIPTLSRAEASCLSVPSSWSVIGQHVAVRFDEECAAECQARVAEQKFVLIS